MTFRSARTRTLKTETTPRLVAIVGASGAGKTWLAMELRKRLGKEAAVLCLDRFYRDRSHLPLKRRARLNFDHPRSIDWDLFEQALKMCLAGVALELPRYDFQRHTRVGRPERWRPKRVVLVEGLWLLRRPSIRRLFSLTVFVECPVELQLARRIKRDIAERGRSEAAVREQYAKTVLPMFERYVQPQAACADRLVQSPPSPREVERLLADMRELLGQGREKES